MTRDTVTLFTRPRLIVYVLLSAAAASAMQLLTTPIEQLGRAEVSAMAIDLTIQFGLTGIGVGTIARLGARGLGAWHQVLLLSLLVTAIAYAHANVGFQSFVYSLSFARPGWHSFFYDFWHGAFYAGLFMLACVFGIRAEQTRRLLGQAEIARSRTEAQLDEARLQALRGHVDPAFLARVMAEIQRRYSTERRAADALLDLLVVFLREAMPAVRSGCSSLAAEVSLAHPYLALRAEIEPSRAPCRIHVQPGLCDVPFPPLLLLPLLDQLAAASRMPADCAVQIAQGPDGTVTLAFSGPPASHPLWIEDALAHRLQVGLHSIYGAQASLRLGNPVDVAARALTIELRANSLASPPGREHGIGPPPPHFTEELQHG